MDLLYEVELLETVPFPAIASFCGTDFGPFVFGPDRTKLFGNFLREDRILEVDVATLEPRLIDVEFDGPVQVNRMAVNGAGNWAVLDLRERAMLVLSREFKLLKRISFDTDHQQFPLDVIGIKSGGFIVSVRSPRVLLVVKFDSNGYKDWQSDVAPNSEPFVGTTDLYCGNAESCFLLARISDTTGLRLDTVKVIRCDAQGYVESEWIFFLESPSRSEQVRFLGKMQAVTTYHEYIRAVMALGYEGGALFTCGTRASIQPVLVRHMAGEKPRVYRLPFRVRELMPFDEKTFWGRPVGSARLDTLACIFRIPPWEEGLPFSKFIAGRSHRPGPHLRG